MSREEAVMNRKHRRLGVAAAVALVLIAPAVVIAQTLSIPQGTVIDLRLSARLTSASARAGDSFRATTVRALWIGGRRILPAGTIVTGEIEAVSSLHDGARSGVIGVRFVSIALPGAEPPYPIVAGLTGQRQDDRPPLAESGDKTSRVETVLVGGTSIAGRRAHILVGDDLAQEYARTRLSGIDAEVAAGTLVSMELDEPLFVSAAMRRGAAAAETPRVDAAPVGALSRARKQ
jgi:hypothetical protein